MSVDKERIFINGQENADKIPFSQGSLKNALDYFRDVAGILKNEDGELILAKQYEKIAFVRADAVLNKYLLAKTPEERQLGKQELIFPFGLNEGQKLAVTRAFSSQISIIQGPTGTDKTQAILNIIANAIMFNKTVAVVSNKNSSIATVVDELKKSNLDFLTAFLGNAKKKERFIWFQSGKYPNMSGWQLSDNEIDSMRSRARYIAANIDGLLAEHGHVAQLKQSIADLKIERQYFEESGKSNKWVLTPLKEDLQLSSSQALSIRLECEDCYKKGVWNNVAFTIRNIHVLRKIYGANFWRSDPQQTIFILQKHYYAEKIKELKDEMQNTEGKFDSAGIDAQIQELANISMKLLADFVAKKYLGKTERQKFKDLQDLGKRSQEVNKEYPIILSAAQSIRSSLSNIHMYDYLIIDEASQVDVVTGALALACAKNVVIAGDLTQLPNLIPKDIASQENTIWSKYTLSDFYRYSEKNNFLASAIGIWPDMPHTLLRKHYHNSKIG